MEKDAPELPEQADYKPPADKFAVAALLTAAATLSFGIVKLLHYLLRMEPNTQCSESVGWQNIESFFCLILLGIPPAFFGSIALIFAGKAFRRCREMWFRDSQSRECIILSFLFDGTGMLIPFLIWLLLRVTHAR